MPGRHYTNANGYRYGFNGKENDNEVVGTGEGTQDYGLRIYNPSLGKFLSVDPLAREFPWNSTYAFAENDVIRSADLDGAEKDVKIHVYDPQNPNRRKHNYIIVMRWSKLFPGQEHGPEKTGTMHFVYNIVTKKIEQSTWSGERLKAWEDNILYKNSGAIIVEEKGSGGTPEVKVYDPLTGNTQAQTGKNGGPPSFDEKIDYDVDYIDNGSDDPVLIDNYQNEDGKKTVGIGLKKEGDTADVYIYNEPQNGADGPPTGQHNYEKGSKGWIKGVKMANEGKKIEDK